MSHKELQNNLKSLKDALALLEPGERFVICTPTSQYASQLVDPLIDGLDRSRKGVFISFRDSRPSRLSKPSLGYLNFASTKSLKQALTLLRPQLRRASRSSIAVIDSSVVGDHWISGRQNQRAFFIQASRLLLKKKIASVWLMSHDVCAYDQLVSIKDDAEYFLEISKIGSDFFAQFLTAKGLYQRDFFLPRLVSVTPTSVHLQKTTFQNPTLIGESPPQEALDLEEKHQKIFEAANEGIIISDIKGHYKEVNTRACEILGYGRDELKHLRLADVVQPGTMFHTLRTLILLQRKGRISAEWTIKKKNGKQINLAFSASSTGNDRFIAIFRDVTDSKKSERQVRQSEERYRTLVDMSPYPQAVFVNNKLILHNQAFQKVFSWIVDGMGSPITISKFFGRQNKPVVTEIAKIRPEDIQSGEILRRELLFSTPEKERTFEVSFTPVPYGNKFGIQCVFVEVTERKSLIQELQETSGKLRVMIDSSVDAISVAQNGRFTFVNKAFLDMFGYSNVDEVIDKETTLVAAKNERKRFLGMIKSEAVGTDHFEYSGTKKDGGLINIDVQVQKALLGGQQTEIAYHRDITPLKQAREELQRKAKALETINKISLSVNQSIQVDEVYRFGLDATMKELAYESGALYIVDENKTDLTMTVLHDVSKKIVDTLGKLNIQEGIAGYVAKTREPLLLSCADYPAYLPHKSLFETEQINTIAWIPIVTSNSIAGIMLLVSMKRKLVDGDFRKDLASVGELLGKAIENARTHSQLKEAEERYRSAVENISDVIYHAAPSGSLLFMSPTVGRVFGYSPQEFYRWPDLWVKALHPDDRLKYSQRISSQAQGVNEFHLEYRVLPKGKASYRWVRDSIRYNRNENGEIESVTGILSDVTDRIELEEALTKSEELKSNVLESIQEGVVVYDTDFRYVDWNKAMEVITGIPRESVIGQHALESTPQMMTGEIRPLLQRALSGEAVSSEDLPIDLPNSEEERYIWARYSPLRDRENKIQGVVGIVTDVTNRKRLERNVRESEETLRNVIDGMGDALMISDLQGRVWEVNREFTQLTGYARSEVLGLNFPYPWVVDEEMASFVTWIAELRENNFLRDLDMTWRGKDNNDVAISLNTTLLRNALGEPVAMLNIARDISDRKRLSLELEKKNRQIELLNRIISKANTTMDFIEIFDSIAQEVAALVSYDRINVFLLSEDSKSIVNFACDSRIGKPLKVSEVFPIENSVSKLAIEQQKAIVIGNLAEHKELGPHIESVAKGFQSEICIPIILNERVLGTFNIASVKENAYNGEELAFLQPIAEQVGAIIDRVRLFHKVSDDSKYIHNLLNSIDSVVYTIDNNYRVTEVNKAWRDFAMRHGLKHLSDESSIIGRSLKEIAPTPRLWEAYERVMPKLFSRKVDYYSEEFELYRNGEQKTYHLAINPMIINDKVTGLVFTNTDITEIKRTEEEIKRRNKELVALNAISSSINRSLHLEEVLRDASEQIRNILGADIVLFYLRDERKNRLMLAQSLGIPDSLTSEIRFLNASHSATGTVISGRQPLLIGRNLQSDERVTPEGREMFQQLGINSLGVVPLLSKDKVLGALDVAFKNEHEFNEQEQQLLLLVGNQIGAAVENAQLYAEVQAQVQRITLLYELGKALTGSLDIQSMLETVYVEASRAIPLDRFEYLSFSEEHHSLTRVLEIADGRRKYHNPNSTAHDEAVKQDSPLWNVATTGSPFIGESNIGGSLPVADSMLAIPVRSKEKVVGVLSIVNHAADAYTEIHLRLFESIATLTGIAIEKAMLYEDTVSKSIEIENRNKELDDFTYVVSHDLKEPLISVEGYSKILLNDYKDKIDDTGREYLGSVVQSSTRMKNLINDLLTLSRLGRVAETLEVVSVDDIVKAILQDFQFILKERNVVVHVMSPLPKVRYNETQLSMVFRNLISNAIKFNENANPRIEISMVEEEAQYVFALIDNGIGIQSEYFDKIFMIFQRLHRSEDYQGTGAGLTIVKRIIEKHRGRIWVDSIHGKGTTFSFTIPK